MVFDVQAENVQSQVSVNRLNFGVYFNFKMQYYPVIDNWVHTFKVPLPKFRFDMFDDMEKEILERRGLLTECNVNVTRFSNVTVTRYPNISADSQSNCNKLAKYVHKFLDMTHDGTQYLKRLNDAIYTLVTRHDPQEVVK